VGGLYRGRTGESALSTTPAATPATRGHLRRDVQRGSSGPRGVMAMAS
jgi:hypothetical protein